MRQMPGYPLGFGPVSFFVVLPIEDYPTPLQARYRALRHRGLDSRALMQIALGYARPLILSDDGHDTVGLFHRVKNSLMKTDGLTEHHPQDLHALIDFLIAIGPLLRDRLEAYTGIGDHAAHVTATESNFLIVGVQQPECSNACLSFCPPHQRAIP